MLRRIDPVQLTMAQNRQKQRRTHRRMAAERVPLSPADQALIEEAIVEGKLQHCAPGSGLEPKWLENL